jgi:hypothetical protein
VKKKWGKKSFPLEMKTVSHGKTKALNCMIRKPVTEQPRRRGRPPLSSLADRSDVMKLALTPGLSKISCKDLLVDFTTTSSPLSVARFEVSIAAYCMHHFKSFLTISTLSKDRFISFTCHFDEIVISEIE